MFLPSAYFVPSLLILAMQVFFAVHCIRRGNPAWLLLIVFVPLVGSLVYLFVEYLPEVRARGGIEETARLVKERINPAAEIQRLEDQVALSNSLNNRLALARAYVRAGRTDDAIAIYRDSLTGIHADDPQVLAELAFACHRGGHGREAREAFERARANATRLRDDHLMLSAAIYEDAGDFESAEREYQAILSRPVVGEEARCRYALLLKHMGRTTEANALFDQIVRHARLSPGHYRKAQKTWIEIARKNLEAGETVAG
ncbi:MAG TPA: tetratricopeptide repeat protein [Longimicrobium sp.]|nr:tetratricopeptide repeat protein [Longimicrobium sp.]